MTRFWHIAHPSLVEGDDLMCRNQLLHDGQAPDWAWDEADEGLDGDVVCLFPDTPRGRVEADWLWSDRPDHALLRVDVPDDELAAMTRVEEGYPAVPGRVPAAWITEVRRSHAEDVVTLPGDEY